jgi:hypothetical protein
MEAIGIGCLWFARRSRADPKTFDPSKHVKDIRRALEGIDSISNLKIKGEASFYSGSWSLADDQRENFFPIFAHLEISFDIFLPARVQQKYTLRDPGDAVEALKVKIFYKSRMPVMYVHYPVTGGVADCRRLSPSTAIVAVRKYLDEKLKDDPEVQVQMLGPSPFHANIYLGPDTEENTSKCLDLTHPGDGYGTFYFSMSPESAADQFILFVETYNHTLSSFYLVVRLRNHSSILATEVIDATQELLEPPSGGVILSFNYWRAFKGRIDPAFQSLLREKMNRLSQARTLNALMQDDRLRTESPFIPYIEREIADANLIPDEDVREILLMLEQRRQGYFGRATTLFAGLLGGILGALVGAALTLAVSSKAEIKSVSKKPSISSEQQSSVSNSPVQNQVK